MIRRSITDVARRASEPETLEKLKKQATEILHDLPETAARGLDKVMRSAEASKESVQRWSRKQTAIAIPMLNTSGVLMHSLGTGVPLADSAIQAGAELMRGDHVAFGSENDRLQRKLEKLLPAGDFTIAVANSFPAALTAFSQLVQQRSLVIHRNHAVRLPGGQPLPEAFGTLMPVIQEVGSVGEVRVEDFDELESFCSIVADVGTQAVKLMDFGSRDAMQAVVLPIATLATAPTTNHEAADDEAGIPSAQAMLQQGADFALMPGNGVCGGPECGLLIGRRDAVASIIRSPAWPALSASDSVQAMLVAALESPDAAPMYALLNANIQNLQSRAKRMGDRLGGCDSISQCEVSESSAKLTESGRWELPSQQLRLRHQQLSSEAWANQLGDEMPAVIVGVDQDSIIVDLRWIDAANDNALAALLSGGDANIGEAEPAGNG